MDFVSDALQAEGGSRRLDNFTKESVDIALDHGISGHYVTRALDQAVRSRGVPRAIRTDQGPEFTGGALDQWAYRNGVQLKLIQPDKLTQNAYIESFNGRFRDECLNEHWFTSVAEARILVATWRRDYNENRPHSSLDYQTPAEFAARIPECYPRLRRERKWIAGFANFAKSPLALRLGRLLREASQIITQCTNAQPILDINPC